MNKQTLIDNLNEDLAGELSAVIQYTTYAAKATGPYRPQLKQFYLEEVPDKQAHDQFPTEKIVALGVSPRQNHVQLPKQLPTTNCWRQFSKRSGGRLEITRNGSKRPRNLATKGWLSNWKI